jgi:hypothetical protein
MDRDARNYESRLKQYETEIAELKVRCDTMMSDSKRKSDDNDVRHEPIDCCLC